MPAIEKKNGPKLIEKSNRDIWINGIKYSDFTMGADPELRFKGVTASSLAIPATGKFGLDGCADIAELRPTPQYDPINLTHVMGETMLGGWHLYPKTREYQWLAGSLQDDKPLGGHIHFGSDCTEGMDLKADSLNKLLAPVVLMLENTEAAKSRRRNYGSLSKSNRCYDKHPEYGGFEYRVLPSWLVSRNFCAGVLSLAKVIMFEAHNKGLRPSLVKRLNFITNNAEFETNFHNCNKIFFIQKIPTIYRIIKKLTLFPKYENHINYLFNYVFQGRTWEDNLDIKERWNIVPKKIKVIEKPKILTKVKPEQIWTSGSTLVPF